MIKTMLAAVDGSDQSIKAAALAGELAAKSGAKLIILHVLLHRDLANLRRMAEVEHLTEPMEVQLGMTPAIAHDVSAAMREIGTHSLPYDALRSLGQSIAKSAEQTAQEQGVETVTTLVKDGDPVEEILKTAAEEKADMIFLGSRGIGPVQSLVMGSVSNKVSQTAPCSCVTVK